ncbi:hypothetical protein MQY53_001619 [Salmonella enterica subsp. enterica]|nr:hypothetical protein [Salmonella enterica]EIZ8584093.1 hypothetical protein [Salmonella enterica subsp. enterica]
MGDAELLKFIRPEGRYEVVNINGKFIVRPLSSDEIIISRAAHNDCKKYFRINKTEL